MERTRQQGGLGPAGDLSRSIVFVRTGALGDFVLSLPLLREACGRAGVCLVTRAAYRAVLPPGVEPASVVDIDGAGAAGLFDAGASLDAALAERLRGADVFWFSSLDEAARRNLERRGARRVLGFDSRPSRPPHIIERFFRSAGLPCPPGVLRQPLWPERPRGLGLWIHPGSGSPRKALPADFASDFAARWQAARGGPVRVSFGEADRALAEPAAASLRARGVRFEPVVNPPLGELRRRMAAEAHLYLGADSGVSHLAGALGLYTLAGFRHTDPEIWRPMGRGEAFRVGVEAAEALLSGALDRAGTAPDRGPVPAQSRPAGERDAGAR